MRFDPFKYIEVKANEEIQIKKGWLRLRASQPGALFITCEGFEALAGVNCEFALQVSDPGTARLEAPEGTRVFIEVIDGTSYASPDEEVFTNIDRMVSESGSLLEVKKALRMLEIERRSIMAQIRQESALLASQRAAAAPAPAPAPVTPPAPAEPQGEAQ